ncbi:rubrerythrin [Desulfocarbo indianensis]|nr:rubrerythrin [Desulfocarbo indianensis]
MYQFILHQPLDPDLEAGLKRAFAGESQAHVRNQAFAAKAQAEGYPQIAALFQAVAEAERVHAAEYLKFLEGVAGSTEENLRRAFENENKARDEAYPELIKQAFAAKRDDLAWSYIRARDVEERHAALYKSALSALAGERRVAYHVCQVCGYVFEDEPPEICPVCKSGRDKFKVVE